MNLVDIHKLLNDLYSKLKSYFEEYQETFLKNNFLNTQILGNSL